MTLWRLGSKGNKTKLAFVNCILNAQQNEREIETYWNMYRLLTCTLSDVDVRVEAGWQRAIITQSNQQTGSSSATTEPVDMNTNSHN